MYLSLSRTALLCSLLFCASIFAGDEDNFDTETLNKNGFLILCPDNFPCSDELNSLKPLFALADASTSTLRRNGASITLFMHFFEGEHGPGCWCFVGNMNYKESSNMAKILFEFFSRRISKLPGLEQFQNFFVEFTLNDPVGVVDNNIFQVGWHRDSSALPTEFVIVLNVESNYPDHDFTLGRTEDAYRQEISNTPRKSDKATAGELIPHDKIHVVAQIPVQHNYGYLINEQVGLADKSSIYHATTVAQFPHGCTQGHTRKTLIVRATPLGTDTHKRLFSLYQRTCDSLAKFMKPYVKEDIVSDSSSTIDNDSCTTTASSTTSRTVSNNDHRETEILHTLDDGEFLYGLELSGTALSILLAVLFSVT